VSLATVPRPATCHPERPHYAKGLCQSCYRKQRFGTAYQRSRYSPETLASYRTRYELTPQAKERQQRYYRARKAIGHVLGVSMPRMSEVFSNPETIARLQKAFDDGNPTLIDIWDDLTPRQKRTIH
jgi:hypothetical protein